MLVENEDNRFVGLLPFESRSTPPSLDISRHPEIIEHPWTLFQQLIERLPVDDKKRRMFDNLNGRVVRLTEQERALSKGVTGAKASDFALNPVWIDVQRSQLTIFHQVPPIPWVPLLVDEGASGIIFLMSQLHKRLNIIRVKRREQLDSPELVGYTCAHGTLLTSAIVAHSHSVGK
jgi:hypothetical protein